MPPDDGETIRVPTSIWAQFAAGLLIAWGGLLLVSGILPNSYGFGTIPIAIGIVILLIGAAVWRHHQWARVVGIVVAALGIVLGVEVLPSVFNQVGEAGSTWPLIRWELTLSIVPYILIIVGLVLGDRHFSHANEVPTR